MLSGLSRQKEYILFVSSMGNLSLLKTVTKEKVWRIILCETNPYLLKYMMEKYDLSFLWKHGDIMFLYAGESESRITGKIQQLAHYWKYMALNLRVLSLPNSWCYGNVYNNIFRIIRSALQSKLYSEGTSLEDKFIGTKNLIQNLEVIVKSYDLDELKGKFSGYPAIVVASGPSLEKNIDLVEKAQDKAVIIACDASLEALKAHGVRSDAIASIERDEPTYRAFFKDKTFADDLVLFGPANLWPKTLAEYPGKMVLCHRLDRGDDALVEHYIGNIKFHGSIGYSCSNVALMYADYMGCSPIILIGQDLAYTDGKIHSDETHIKEVEGENDTSTSDGIMVEDIYGNMIPSRIEYSIFKNWIESMIAMRNIEVVDATEGGAKIQGSNIMTLKEAIDTYCKCAIPRHVYDCLPEKEEMSEATYIQKVEALIEHLKRMNQRVKLLEENTLNYYQKLKELPEKEELKLRSEKELEAVLKVCTQGDAIIGELLKDEDLKYFLQQHIDQAIVRIKALGNEVTAEAVAENIYHQKVLMAYLHDSCFLIYDEYQTYIETMEEKVAAKRG
jgi:hypothetical protein